MTEAEHPDVAFLETVVKKIVENPDAVRINRKVDEMGVLIELQVAKEDMGRIVGKSGQTAKSLRILLRVIGSKNNARVNMKILEPEDSEGSFTPAEEPAAPAADASLDDDLGL